MERSDVTNKEELIAYLNSNGEGIPFLEELWDICVQKAKENEDKDVPMKTTTIIQKDGTVVEKKQVAGVVIKDPIPFYFRLYKLPQYKKKALKLLDVKDEQTEGQKEIMEVYFDDEDNEESFNEIIQWINMFEVPNEKQYLKQRYSHYYDNYEINDGADRTMLSGILSLEIELYRINFRRAKGKSVDINQEEKLRKMLRESLEAQKWTKKQRSATDEMAQNKFTIWLDKQFKNGGFEVEERNYPKDEIDYLIEIIPQATREMLE